MSLILDALNRSRQDGDAVPGLGSEHFADEPSAVRRYVPWAGLLLALLVIAWLLLGDDQASIDQDPGHQDPSHQQPASQGLSSESAAATATPASSPAEAAGSTGGEQLQPQGDTARNNTRAEKPAPQSQSSESAAQAAAGPAKAPATQPPPAMKTPQAEQTQAALKPRPATAARPSASDRSALEALYAQSRQATQTKTQKKAAADAPTETGSQPLATPAAPADPVDVEEILRLAEQEVANAKLEEHPAPFLVQLSQQVKNDIPSIMYQRHDYSSTGGQSKVTLNGKILRVGGAPAGGMRVDEILEDSVVLTYRGTQFRLRALNSWVNL